MKAQAAYDNTFTCAQCGETFEKGRPEGEAEAEWASVLEWQDQPRDVVCEDCWQQVMAWAERQHLPTPNK